MKVGKLFPSAYFKAVDVDPPRTLRIEKVAMETFGRGQSAEEKPVVSFRGEKQRLVLNVTNAIAIEELLGSDDTSDWIGAAITLFGDVTDFAGRRVGCVRIRRPDSGFSQADRGEAADERAEAPITVDGIPF